MTVYAIVNDLTGHTESDECRDTVWTVISPSGILQGGNPYFVPDFDSRFEARLAIALRIGRLGKGIAPRFAYRYVESVAPAVLFVASSLLQRLRSMGLPWSSAVSYDKCLAVGAFRTVSFDEIEECKVGLKIRDRSGKSDSEWTETFPGLNVGELIEKLSRDNTLKTGDIIVASIAAVGPAATCGQTMGLSLNGEDLLKFNVR